MLNPIQKIWILGAVCFLASVSTYGNDNSVYIDNIVIEGNKKTKNHIILRELDIAQGDTIAKADITDMLKRNRQYLINTGIFTDVQISLNPIADNEHHYELDILVKECWFIYPAPVFEIAARNFNVWLQEFGGSLSRTNIGASFSHENFTGNRDKFGVHFQTGFIKNYNIHYARPFINEAKTLGMSANIFYDERQEIRYTSLNNREIFARNENQPLLKELGARLEFQYRPSLLDRHYFDIQYRRSIVSDTITSILNPYFFSEGSNRLEYISLRYQLDIDRRDFRSYPLNGYFLSFMLRKDGIGIFSNQNSFVFQTKYAYYKSVTPKWSWRTITGVQANLIRTQLPYYLYRGLGYGSDFVRGYELYVVDGLDYAYLKSSLRYQLFDIYLCLGKLSPLESYRDAPLKVYAKINSDWGIVNDPFFSRDNPLSNQMLWGGGVGLDIILYHNQVIQLEYNISRTGERGFFIRTTLEL